jgi:NCAIR mutase (PurE)-related protein
MTEKQLHDLLHDFKRGKVSHKLVIDSLYPGMVESLGFAQIDHHREIRQGFPEVILCEGKTEKQVAIIAERIVEHGSPLLGTRASKQHYAAVRKLLRKARYNETARTITANEHLIKPQGRGTTLIVTAGTSDLPVAEEARETARMLGNETELLADVGVAGIHRILAQSKKLRSASVIIVVAGMEGALPSVVGGLVDVPVIAVPTSVGYGTSFGGISALLGMLNSCASGVTVVNIDNGFGAAFAASRINRLHSRQ